MKKIVVAIELYPIYSLRDIPDSGTNQPTIDISNELYVRWLDARKEFNHVQQLLLKNIHPDDINKL